MLEQPLALPDVVRPGDALDTAARLARFAPVEEDAAVRPREMVEHPCLGVDAERRPLVDRRVEPAGREQQQRLPRAHYFITCVDAVDDRRCHAVSYFARFAAPRTWRAARTSSA